MATINYPMASRRAGSYDTDIAYENRRAMGRWLADLRLATGMTQLQVTEACQLGGASALSAVELGRIAMPPEWGERLADLYNVDREEFGRKTLYWTNPWLYALIFGADARLRKMLRLLPDRRKKTE